MDVGQRPTKRVCVTYILSFILLTAFFYHLMSDNNKNNKGLSRLREDVDDISHLLRTQQKDCKEQPSSKFGCLAGEPQGLGCNGGAGAKPGVGRCDSREMNAYVDSMIKRKMGHLMDDVYNLKKQVMSADCGARSANQGTSKSEAVSVIKNRINYASEDLGAKVINVLAHPIREKNIWQALLGLDFNANPPVNMLRPSLATGACFCYSGSKATIALRLAKSIIVDSITYTHVAKELTPNLCVNSAPKEFDVFGVNPNTSKRELLGHWIYNNAPNRRTQSYSVNNKNFFQKLVFAFNSNHGANSTCLYRAVNTYNSSDVALEKQEDQHHRLRHRQSDEAAIPTTTTTMGTKQKQAAAAAAALGEEDDGRGGADSKAEAAGAACATVEAEAEGGANAAAVDKIGWPAGLPYFDLDRDGYGLAAATALTPTDIEEALAGAGVGGGGLSSSRTSLNNSTENLSYASDNYYGDDLILLDDDDDVEAEEISLNSDDCVYAYRGDRGDFDLSLEGVLPSRGGMGMGMRSGMTSGSGMGGGGGRHHLDVIIGRDDETEFLEMDFEPDPSSELELDGGMAALPQANLLLMQRDFSQMSESRQLYSSPIDDYPPQEDVLQQQKQRLSKKFARISLNLDQIKDHSGVDLDLDMELRSGVKVDGVGLPEERQEELVPESLTQTAHSLPSSFSRSTSVPPNDTEPKLTGAKPKRLMSKSSSSSSKPRRSQNSSSFDERCFSCTDFRLGSNQQAASSASSTQQLDPAVAPMLVAAAAVVAMASSNSNHSSSSMAQFDLTNEQETTCLDCLEKEFLANTIGKALDLTSCAKCRRRGHAHKGSSLSLYNQTPRCRSGSPVFFDELSGGIYSNWPTAQAQPQPSLPPPAAAPTYNQRFISCDNNFGGLPLLKPSFSTEPPPPSMVVVSARLSTASSQLCDEEHLVQALDKLHISYDKSLLHLYFERAAASSIRPSPFEGNLKQLLLHVSKQQCNHRKLKKLIELVTQQQLNVQFKRTNESKPAFVPVKVSDILEAWSRHRDLSVLRQLDNRFHQANVMGKIGHIVRQAAKAAATSSSTAASSSSTTTARRALPEFIMIPQYYACGELTLTRKC